MTNRLDHSKLEKKTMVIGFAGALIIGTAALLWNYSSKAGTYVAVAGIAVSAYAGLRAPNPSDYNRNP